MTNLNDNLHAVRDRMIAACARAGRSLDEVTLLAVSKGHDVEAIGELYELGVRDFGESYVQEWEEKVDALPSDIRWHFVGHLQSNKARFLTDRVELVHSVDRKSVMKALNKRSDSTSKVLLQVNVAEDPNKSGAAPDEVVELARRAVQYERLSIRGLMTIPPYSDDPELARPHFRALREASDEVRQWLNSNHPERAKDLSELSMGMTADFDVAIEEGATIIRVGTALFGARSD